MCWADACVSWPTDSRPRMIRSLISRRAPGLAICPPSIICSGAPCNVHPRSFARNGMRGHSSREFPRERKQSREFLRRFTIADNDDYHTSAILSDQFHRGIVGSAGRVAVQNFIELLGIDRLREIAIHARLDAHI